MLFSHWPLPTVIFQKNTCKKPWSVRAPSKLLCEQLSDLSYSIYSNYLTRTALGSHVHLLLTYSLTVSGISSPVCVVWCLYLQSFQTKKVMWNELNGIEPLCHPSISSLHIKEQTPVTSVTLWGFKVCLRSIHLISLWLHVCVFLHSISIVKWFH